jgi:hypothetical protein
MEAFNVRTRWTDESLDDLKASVDSLRVSVDDLRHAFVLAVIGVCTMMFAGFGAAITLIATHF